MHTVPLQLLAEPTRERILRMVWHREHAAGDIAAAFDVSFSAISQHLALLLDAGLVARRREGRRQFYRARPEALGPLARALEQMWFGSLSTLKALAEAEQLEIDRNAAPGAGQRAERAKGASRQVPTKRSAHHDVQANSVTKPRPRARGRRSRRKDR